VLNVEQAAEVLGLSRTAAYELIRSGEWPTPVFRLGRLIRIPTAPVLRLLGVEPEAIRSPTGKPDREAG
jgi:excisionase family DNA binding protein